MYVSPSTPAKSIREHLEQASVAVENLCAAHATEVEKLKALSSIGTFTKNFAFIAAPTISVSKREDNRFFTKDIQRKPRALASGGIGRGIWWFSYGG